MPYIEDTPLRPVRRTYEGVRFVYVPGGMHNQDLIDHVGHDIERITRLIQSPYRAASITRIEFFTATRIIGLDEHGQEIASFDGSTSLRDAKLEPSTTTWFVNPRVLTKKDIAASPYEDLAKQACYQHLENGAVIFIPQGEDIMKARIESGSERVLAV